MIMVPVPPYWYVHKVKLVSQYPVLSLQALRLIGERARLVIIGSLQALTRRPRSVIPRTRSLMCIYQARLFEPVPE